MLAVLSLMLFCYFRRKLMSAAKAGYGKDARSVGDWSPSTDGSGVPSPCVANDNTIAVEEGDAGSPQPQGSEAGSVRRAWDRLFDLLDRDGDGRVTQEDFQRAPVAAVAVMGALQALQEPLEQLGAQPLLEGARQSFSMEPVTGHAAASVQVPVANQAGAPPQMGWQSPPGPAGMMVPGVPVAGSFVAPPGMGVGAAGMQSVPHPPPMMGMQSVPHPPPI